MLIVLLCFMAFAVDLGYICTARTEIQRTADAAAIASAWELLAEERRLAGDDLGNIAAEVRLLAEEYAARNKVGSKSRALGVDDVTVGYRANIFDQSEPMSVLNPQQFNTVRVRVRQNNEQNGDLPLFFAKLMGYDSFGVQADATAALLTNIKGFTVPSDCTNLKMLPFALDLYTKNAWHKEQTGEECSGGIEFLDEWSYGNDGIENVSDGILELNLYPQGTGSPGNRGTVDIGSSNNSTADIARQITDGISPKDFEHHGGKLELVDGVMYLEADTGISAGFKDELASIIGEKRCIPVFSEISGNGNNAKYTIVGFMGVRVMAVKLTGPMNKKKVTVQPTLFQCRGLIPGDSERKTSDFVFSPVVLVD
jgi:hypothetical protein